MATQARSLAARLAASDDDFLTAAFARRDVHPDAPWNDFFDAAEALLEPSSIERALRGLTRDEAAALVGAPSSADARGSLAALLLTDADGTRYPAVADAVAGREVPPAPEAVDSAASDDAQSAHAAERAFRHVAALADVLLAAAETPLAVLADGRMGAGEKRRFVDSGVIVDGAELDDLTALSLSSDLAVVSGRALHVSTRGQEWLRRSAGERWAVLAEGLRERMPQGIRSGDGWTALDTWPQAHPWDPEWPEQHAAVRRQAHLLGLIADDASEPEWAAPLRRGERADPGLLERLLPAEVDRIFLQNDLSAIAPGRLASALDVRLRALTVHESATQASSYRFTAESVARALALGESEASILAFLEEVSLTGIPQPLGYLVAQAAARHGLVRVSPETGEVRTRIRSSDGHLLEALLVDQSLRPLRLLRDGDTVVSKVSSVTVFWALTDARYPATLVDELGAPVVAGRPAAPPAATAAGAEYSPLIARLRAHHGPDADAAWLVRALEGAVSARSLLTVEVAMPDGSAREFVLEATGLGGGRLRGRDRAADVERTLPVSSIRAVRIGDAD